MKFSIPVSLRKTAKATIQDGIRPILGHIKLTNKEAIAADGWMLAIRKLETPIDIPEGEGILIPAKMLNNSIFNLRKGSKDTLTVEEQKTSGECKGRITISRGDVSLSQSAFDGKYPDSNNLWNTAMKKPEVARIGFTIGILKRLLEAVDDDTFISFRVCRPDEPVIFRTKHSRGIIMPAATDYAHPKSEAQRANWDEEAEH
jgi:hypothetical protein